MWKVAFPAVAIVVLSGCLGSSSSTPAPAFDPTPIVGTYTGNWHNLTFGTTGTGNLVFAANTTAKTATVDLTLTGNVFGAPSPSPLHLDGSYTGSKYTGSATGNATFGNVTLSIDSNGNISGTAASVPGGTVSSMTFSGSVVGKTVTLNYTVTLVAGGTANGTFTATKP